jgi:outer membrane protein insertion porin family
MVFKRRYLYVLAIIITILIFSNLLAQSEVYIIDQIKIEGLKNIDKEMVLAALKIQSGDTFGANELAQTVKYDIKRLNKLRAFESIEASLEPLGGNHYNLIYNVTELPIIKEIEIKGNKEISSDDIMDEIMLQPGERYNPAELYQGIAKIKDEYKEKGYRQIQINETIIEDGSKVKIVIDVEEGNKITIHDIKFTGNNHITEWELRNKVMNTKEDKFYNTKTLDMEIFEEDLEKIEERYRDKGYLDAEVVDYEISELPDKNQINIIINIDEGQEYVVSRIEISGFEKIDETTIRNQLDLYPDKPFSEDKLDSTVTKIMQVYYDNGYLFADVEDIIEKDEDTGLVDINIKIREGEKARVNKIIITGNTTTKDIVIRREMRLFPGDIYNEAKLIRSLQRVFNLGYFDNVEREFIPVPETNQLDLLVRVTERPGTLKLNFGAGYSTIDGLVGQIQSSWINFDASKLPFIWKCKGGGQQLDFSTEFGKKRFNFNIGFTEPWFLGNPILFGFDFYKSHYVRTYYDEDRFGGALRFGKALSEYVYGKITYKYEVIDVQSNIDDLDDLPIYIREQLGRENTSSVSFNINRNSKDNIMFPSQGSDSTINIEIAGGIFGGTSDFYKISGHTSWYNKLFWKNVLAINFAAGFVNSYGSTEEVPIYERFYLGGARTIRGYEDWDVGPIDQYGNPEGGNVMFYSNFEYRIPIVTNKIYTLAFWDAGYCWRNFHYVDFKDLKSGVGGGVRFDVPMLGLMGFDYGYSISEKHGRLHFSFGTTF